LNYRAAREELVKAQRELPNNAQVFQMFGSRFAATRTCCSKSSAFSRPAR
jgi:hypothetical protein